MAKIITENFRVETANEFVKSYRTNNEAVVGSFQLGLQEYNSDLPLDFIPEEDTEDGQRLTDEQVVSITNIARQNINSILPQNTYYVMASGVSDDGEVENTQFKQREFTRRCLFGNKLDETNIRYMFRQQSWVSGTVYDSFDDTINMQNTNFYVTILDGDVGEASFKVFKCIRNNNGGQSTIRPSTANLDIYFETTLEDGYVWKYMFEVPASEYLTFATSSTLPYVSDAGVINASQERLSDIKIVNTDFGIFADYLVGDKSETSLKPASTILNTVEIDSVPDNTYRISITAENPVRNTAGAYKNLYLRIVSTGEIFEILNSEIPNNVEDPALNKILVLFVKSETSILGRVGLEAEIVPIIEISKPDADASGTRALAYGILDYTGTIVNVQFKEKGSGYKTAQANLKLPIALEDRAENNNFRTIMSPSGGHGSNPILELFMSEIAVTTNFFKDALRFTPTSNTYTKVALVKNPTFYDGTSPGTFDNRVVLTFNADVEASFSQGFYVSQVKNNGQIIEGRVHEVSYDAATTTTTVYLYDTVGPYSDKFQALTVAYPEAVPPVEGFSGEITVRAEANAAEFETFVINNVVTEKLQPYTGQVLHFVNFDPIERTEDRREKIKLVFDF